MKQEYCHRRRLRHSEVARRRFTTVPMPAETPAVHLFTDAHYHSREKALESKMTRARCHFFGKPPLW